MKTAGQNSGEINSLTANDISKLVGNVEQSVTVIKARPAFQRFEVNLRRRISRPYVSITTHRAECIGLCAFNAFNRQ